MVYTKIPKVTKEDFKTRSKILKVPNLRFPEFKEEWEEKTLKEMGTFLGGGTPTSANPDFWNGTFPWISSSDLEEDNINTVRLTRFITQNAIDNSATKLCRAPVILIVSRVGVGKVAYSIKDVCTSQDFTNIIDIKCNGLFLAFLLSNVMKKQLCNVQGTSIKGISSAEIKSLKVFIPKEREQLHIANFISLIDERIKCQSKLIKGWESFKGEIIKKIFSGQIKFKDNEANDFPAWQNKTLGEITTIVNKKNKDNEKFPVYSINNKSGFIPQNEQFEGIDSNSRGYNIQLYKIINKNTFAYNPARINVGSIGYSGDLDNIIISSLYVCFRTNSSINDYFLLHYLKTDFFKQDVLKKVEGGVRDYLFYENFAKISLSIPCIVEQLKIATFLSNIDNKIDLETALLKQLKLQKKYLLQQLFI